MRKTSKLATLVLGSAMGLVACNGKSKVPALDERNIDGYTFRLVEDKETPQLSDFLLKVSRDGEQVIDLGYTSRESFGMCPSKANRPISSFRTENDKLVYVAKNGKITYQQN